MVRALDRPARGPAPARVPARRARPRAGPARARRPPDRAAPPPRRDPRPALAAPRGHRRRGAVRRPARRRRQPEQRAGRGLAAAQAARPVDRHGALPAHLRASRRTPSASSSLLGAGEVREAAEAYAGPLLPGSDAPGIVAARERLEAWLRQAVMTADDPEALWAWVEHGQRPRRPRRLEAPAGLARVPRPAPQPRRRPRGRAAPRLRLTAPPLQRPCNAAGGALPSGAAAPGRGSRQDAGREGVARGPGARPHAGLSTARAALQVAWLLARRPEGVRADEVAEIARQERLHRLQRARQPVRGGRRRPPSRRPVPARARLPREGGRRRLRAAAGARAARLLAGRRRAATRAPTSAPTSASCDDGVLRVVVERGQRGMPRLDMDPEIRDSAHALALGKVVLALAGPDAVDRYVRAGLPAFTPQTDHGPRPAARRARGRSAAPGWRSDCEEFAPDFCCLAAPILDARGHFLAVAGISMSRRAFAEERPRARGGAARRGPSRRPRGHDGGAVPAMCGSARAS